MTDKRYSRENLLLNFTLSSSYLNTLLHLPVLGKTLLTILPAVIYGCSDPMLKETDGLIHERTRTACIRPQIKTEGHSQFKHLDIFTFNDDALQRLESYQRVENSDELIAKIALLKGEKVIFSCANSQRNSYSWNDICSRAAIEDIHADLEKENPEALLMSGEIHTSTESSLSMDLPLTPLASRITLSSLRFDFSARPYRNAKISGIKAYLTNVNAEYPISGVTSMPLRIVNAGRLNQDDLKKFDRKENIFTYIADKASEAELHPGTTFLAYPNTCKEESPGNPFTRLVIEADIGSDKYYWPINVNRNTYGEGKGVERNCQYIYDILITRKGTDNPDIPMDVEGIEINMEIRRWTDKEEYGVSF